MKFYCILLVLCCFCSIKCLRDKEDREKAQATISDTFKSDDVQRFYEIMQDNDIKKHFENETSPLHYSIEFGAKKIFDDLIENGADVNAPDQNTETPLHYAALNPDMYFADTLIKKGAKVNKHDDYTGNTPLHNSAINSNPKVMELLFNNGANISDVTHNGQTALHLAAYNRNEEVPKLLIEKGVDIHAKCCYVSEDGFGQISALFKAVRNSNEKVAEILINAGLNVNDGSENAFTGRLDAYTPIFLIALTGQSVQVDYDPVYRSRSQFLRRLEELENEHANHPVHENVIERLVDLLIKNGADINHKAAFVGTPLQYCRFIGNKKFEEALIKHGATA